MRIYAGNRVPVTDCRLKHDTSGRIDHIQCVDGVKHVQLAPIATERVTSDPDAAIARSYVSSGHSSLCYASLDALLLRLADKVEGKS